jgi:hypothetical protein
MKGKWGIAVLISVILLAATSIWSYLSTVTELPAMGFGLAIPKGVLMGILVALAIILGIAFAKMGKAKN